MTARWLSRIRQAVGFGKGTLPREVTEKRALGDAGEEAAVAEICRRGYRILTRNYLTRMGEIDIIAEHDGTLVFIEVKTRSPRAWASPESAITPEKITRMRRAARRYLFPYAHPAPHRFESVAILTDNSGKVSSIRIETLPVVLYPEKSEAPATL